jgi:hypothetical protein
VPSPSRCVVRVFSPHIGCTMPAKRRVEEGDDCVLMTEPPHRRLSSGGIARHAGLRVLAYRCFLRTDVLDGRLSCGTRAPARRSLRSHGTPRPPSQRATTAPPSALAASLPHLHPRLQARDCQAAGYPERTPWGAPCRALRFGGGLAGRGTEPRRQVAIANRRLFCE